MTDAMQFPFMDTIAGRVEEFTADRSAFSLITIDGRRFQVRLDGDVSAQILRNLGEPRIDAGDHLRDMLTPGRHLFAYGIFYPDGGTHVFSAKELTFLGRAEGEYAFEQPGWWIRQINEIAGFYRHAQFGDGPVDFRNYRTVIRLGGEKNGSHVQETDTISRLVYGMASAYMLTGNEAYLDVADQGTRYLRDQMRVVDPENDVVYWYHGMETGGDREKKLFTSEFGDDYDAIPMYEQIYALAGPAQTYRVTGDKRIASDINATLRLFEKFFRDHEGGGYYSHIDPILLSPHHESLGPNKSRKNWNSIGDHAPAYLINYFLATGDERHLEMLERTFDTIVERFPDASSPFVNERFHADWSHDLKHGWQQDRAVVGHNLKIAWNLTRMHGVRPKDSYRELAEQLARSMPAVGSDLQRGGWYDVVERHLSEGDTRHAFAWHDRKAWWQQEQAILAYLILAGQFGGQDYLEQARQASAFYNAFFLDHDEGAVYFNVLASGMPYLLGTERLKGSHSMSMYHSAELCYLATVYTRLLLTRQPLTLWFRPGPAASRTLRVAPDLLPPGKVLLTEALIDGKPHDLMDERAMTVGLPQTAGPLTVQVTLTPTG